jgi:hypothetical protein
VFIAILGNRSKQGQGFKRNGLWGAMGVSRRGMWYFGLWFKKELWGLGSPWVIEF